MIQIEEEKIAEMMFDIWHNSDSLKNPVIVSEYIANKLKEAITITHSCKSDSELLICEECKEIVDTLEDDGCCEDCSYYVAN